MQKVISHSDHRLFTSTSAHGGFVTHVYSVKTGKHVSQFDYLYEKHSVSAAKYFIDNL